MGEGLLLGVAAAISFGSSDALAALTSRRVGTLRAAAGALLTSLAALGVLMLVADPHPFTPRDDVALVLGLGALAGAGYLALVNGLRLGPVSVVSPIVSTVGAVSVVLAVAFLDEHPSPLQWLAVAVTTAGGLFVALVPGREGGVRSVGLGPLFALLAVAWFAVAVVGLQGPIRTGGVLQTIFLYRVGNVAVTSLALVAGRGLVASRGAARPVVAVAGEAVPASNAPSRPFSGRARPSPGVISALGVAAVGLLETSGQALRAAGLAIAPAWLLGLVGSLGPAVVVATGIVFLGERPAASQWVGIGLVAAGLVLLALG